MSPWNSNRNETRIVRLDPHVKVSMPTLPTKPTDAQYDELYRARVRANELRRLRAECERIAFLKEQA
jgi:hypothetical protein